MKITRRQLRRLTQEILEEGGSGQSKLADLIGQIQPVLTKFQQELGKMEPQKSITWMSSVNRHPGGQSAVEDMEDDVAWLLEELPDLVRFLKLWQETESSYIEADGSHAGHDMESSG